MGELRLMSRTAGVMVICDSLGDQFEPYTSWLDGLGVRCAFTGDVPSAVRRDRPPLVVLPVFTEVNARRLHELTDEHPGVAVLGVVRDLTGHQTHRAIHHGATWVLNMLLPTQCYKDVLLTLAGTYLTRGPTSAPTSEDEDEELIRLLCGTATVAEISKHFYCSERSMYRRLRSLYSRLGVRGRNQLRAHVARSRQDVT
ncbi:hypothetical protein AGRA3207_003491 [Actinomadura graeca]|uniref:Uncharacterized protein n=1 Tax=Actinomadura graeca TaxID=2750812 RepID=A0ABX8QUS3_9ACTN|nr:MULTISPECIES: hypothetical protein [Actinomadura]QXJ22487.1 hypothetical protein AGRA3207_003491 [Actinomadura graeca]